MSHWFRGELPVIKPVDAIDLSLLSLSHTYQFNPRYNYFILFICNKIFKNISFFFLLLQVLVAARSGSSISLAARRIFSCGVRVVECRFLVPACII